MTPWLSQIAFALMVSVVGLTSLKLIHTAPNRLCLWIAMFALSAVLLPAPAFIPISELATDPISGVLTSQIQSTAAPVTLDWLNQIIILVLLISPIWILLTVCRSWVQLRHLKRGALPAQSLMDLADDELAQALKTTTIYRVKDSAIVATSGYLNPVVWIGDKISDPTHLRCALNHEFRHIAYGDQFLLLLIVILERLQWWNPVTWKIGELARDAMEYACDDWCASSFERTTYRTALAELMLLKLTLLKPTLLKQGKPAALQLNMFQQSKQMTRLEKLNMKKSLNKKHGSILVTGFIAVSLSAITLAELPAAQTLESCHTLLPAGSYELNITSTKNRESGEIKVSLVDHEDETWPWQKPPERVLPFIECVRQVVGVGKNEGWPGSQQN